MEILRLSLMSLVLSLSSSSFAQSTPEKKAEGTALVAVDENDNDDEDGEESSYFVPGLITSAVLLVATSYYYLAYIYPIGRFAELRRMLNQKVMTHEELHEFKSLHDNQVVREHYGLKYGKARS